MTRRHLFAALASLPFVGRFVPASYTLSLADLERLRARHLAEHLRAVERHMAKTSWDDHREHLAVFADFEKHIRPL